MSSLAPVTSIMRATMYGPLLEDEVNEPFMQQQGCGIVTLSKMEDKSLKLSKIAVSTQAPNDRQI